MNRTNYIGNLATKVALGATLLFSAPNVNANGGIALDQGSSTISRGEIYSKLDNIENRLERMEQSRRINEQLSKYCVSIFGIASGVYILRSYNCLSIP